MTQRRLIVVGGSGFLGSNVCRLAAARSWDVHSISRSGKAWTTPKGHTPSWVKKVVWHAGSAFEPSTYKELFNSNTAIVHTLGVLLEVDYKSADMVQVLSNIINRVPTNPLDPNHGKYERINRDSALTVFEAFQEYLQENTLKTGKKEPFVYVSAEDIFRPLIPSRYIRTKREAETLIETQNNRTRPIFARPGLMYHPHIRPLSTLPAAFLDFTSKIPPPPFLSTFASSLSHDNQPHFTQSICRLLNTPPIHVETVAEAICRSIEDESVSGVIDVQSMRNLTGWKLQSESVKVENA